ncbi:nuclear RNA export factor 1-like isoform X1 [Hylaeus anthracinus]|uniref:nuclear RNA export factor 1-like isoform X1 n=1 Tax=Hylaeus anthracinus TaxID=313031 RepID=UPI0023B9AFC4|nr:nuclear RNA export factor 1-like isoform X1 [Hylaeus anthracinus]
MQRPGLSLVPMQLDSSIAIKISMGGSMFQERMLMSRSDVWHKIKILKGTQYDKESVLKAILNAIDPADLVPVKYQAVGEDTFFLARNCAFALEKLCKTNLIIKYPGGDALILIVTLGYASIHDLKINLQPLLLAALTRRYDPNTKSLNLEEFHKDPEMDKTLFCPLNQQRLFSHVLKLTKSAIDTVQNLNLQKNGILNLSAIEASNLTSIRYLDLRYNTLLSTEMLAPLRKLNILKLWLDGNPLCENYSNPKQYIDSVKKYCPNLILLDGVYVKTHGLSGSYIKYVKDDAKQDLITKFISHFFDLYDQKDRSVLRGLYHKDACYSMTFNLPGADAQKKNLAPYAASRNILRSTDLNKKRQHIYFGTDSILDGMKKLPRSYHDRNSFIWDLMYDDGICLVFSLSGMFKTINKFHHVLAFNRTFVLLGLDDNEYNILNDQYHVEATEEEIPPNQIEEKCSLHEMVPTYFSATEKKELMSKFVEITSLNNEWSQTYLGESHYDIRRAITNFMKDYKDSAVPADAFLK